MENNGVLANGIAYYDRDKKNCIGITYPKDAPVYYKAEVTPDIFGKKVYINEKGTIVAYKIRAAYDFGHFCCVTLLLEDREGRTREAFSFSITGTHPILFDERETLMYASVEDCRDNRPISFVGGRSAREMLTRGRCGAVYEQSEDLAYCITRYVWDGARPQRVEFRAYCCGCDEHGFWWKVHKRWGCWEGVERTRFEDIDWRFKGRETYRSGRECAEANEPIVVDFDE